MKRCVAWILVLELALCSSLYADQIGTKPAPSFKVTIEGEWCEEEPVDTPWHGYCWDGDTDTSSDASTYSYIIGTYALATTGRGEGKSYCGKWYWPEETSCNDAGAGLKSRVFDYIGPNSDGKADCETRAYAYVDGLVQLLDDKCAGTSAGYCKVESTALSRVVQAYIEEAQGASHEDHIGNLGYNTIFDLNIEITASTGLGDHPDLDQDFWESEERLRKCTILHKTRVQIETWAYEPWALGNPAEAKAWYNSSLSSHTTLGE